MPERSGAMSEDQAEAWVPSPDNRDFFCQTRQHIQARCVRLGFDRDQRPAQFKQL
jgi:hypothetical protein